MRPSAEPRATMQAIWRTRPSRRESDRKIAGVAGAIARRYDVDPTLIRIGFVVAASYGFGILLYLAAWAALPADPHQPPKGPLPGRKGSSSVHPVVLVIAGIAGIGSLTYDKPNILVGLAVTAGLLYVLHQNRGERGLQLAQQPGAAPVGAEGSSDPAAGPPADPPRRRSTLTPVTAAMALLAGGITCAITIASGGEHGGRLVAGVMLAVVALGLLVGAFRHRGRGLLLLAVPLLVVCYEATRIGPIDWSQSGDLRIAPTSVSQLASIYRYNFGDVTLDLRNLDLSAPTPSPVSGAPQTAGAAPPASQASAPAPAVTAPSAPPAALPPVQTTIELQVGEVTVLLPPNADIQLHCHADVGSLHCLGQQSENGPSADVQTSDLGLNHQPGERPLDIDITVGAGNVEVHRG